MYFQYYYLRSVCRIPLVKNPSGKFSIKQHSVHTRLTNGFVGFNLCIPAMLKDWERTEDEKTGEKFIKLDESSGVGPEMWLIVKGINC
jgi:hypothetical protein